MPHPITLTKPVDSLGLSKIEQGHVPDILTFNGMLDMFTLINVTLLMDVIYEHQQISGQVVGEQEGRETAHAQQSAWGLLDWIDRNFMLVYQEDETRISHVFFQYFSQQAKALSKHNSIERAAPIPAIEEDDPQDPEWGTKFLNGFDPEHPCYKGFYEAFNKLNAKDITGFSWDPAISYRVKPVKDLGIGVPETDLSEEESETESEDEEGNTLVEDEMDVDPQDETEVAEKGAYDGMDTGEAQAEVSLGPSSEKKRVAGGLELDPSTGTQYRKRIRLSL